jgi:hypothetical protein
MIEHGGPLMILANLALVQEQQEEASRLYDESIQIHRRHGDIWGLSILLSIAGGLRVVRGDLDGAQVCGAEALSLSQALRDPRGIAWSLCADVEAAKLRPLLNRSHVRTGHFGQVLVSDSARHLSPHVTDWPHVKGDHE